MAVAMSDERRTTLSGVEVLLIGLTVELTRIAASTLGDGAVANRPVQILLVIHSDPGVTPSTIAKQLGVAPSSVARVLHALEKRGLVTRTPDVADRRVMRLALTHEGRRGIASFQRELAQYFERSAPSLQTMLRALDVPEPPSDVVHVAPLDVVAELARLGAAYVDDVVSAVAPFGITHPADRHTIALLREHGGLRPVHLASTLNLTTGGVSQLLDRLEANSLVLRTHPIGGDRRTVDVTLTDRGDQAAAVLLDALDRHIVAICSGLALVARVEHTVGAV